MAMRKPVPHQRFRRDISAPTNPTRSRMLLSVRRERVRRNPSPASNHPHPNLTPSRGKGLIRDSLGSTIAAWEPSG